MKTKDNNLRWKVNSAALIKEIVEGSNAGIYKIPLLTFRNILGQVAQRCSQVNDPILNQLMMDLALYEVGDPYTEAYKTKEGKELREKVFQDYEEALKQINQDKIVTPV